MEPSALDFRWIENTNEGDGRDRIEIGLPDSERPFIQIDATSLQCDDMEEGTRIARAIVALLNADPAALAYAAKRSKAKQ
jgi:hypothetical protein